MRMAPTPWFPLETFMAVGPLRMPLDVLLVSLTADVGEISALLASAGHVAIIALISPYRLDRLAAREIARAGGCGFVEVFVDAPLQICEQRDPKDLYRRARAGEIRNLTGIDAPYQPPENPEIHVRTDELSVEACLELILESLLPRLGLERP